MTKTVEFPARAAANEFRNRVSEYLAPGDDRRTRTVRLRRGTPDRILNRLEEAAFQRGEPTRASAGMVELSDRERENLQRTTGFSWREHGFEAMHAKAALQRQGVDTWMDYYEPGEELSSSIGKLERGKRQAMESRAPAGIEGMRTDEEEIGGGRRHRQQAGRGAREQTESAVEPALTQADPEAIDYLREERRFTDDIFDIAFGGGHPTGRDYERLQKRHEGRSERAQAVDESLAAPVTRDPLKWTEEPDQYDYPGIDTPPEEDPVELPIESSLSPVGLSEPDPVWNI